MFSNSIDSENDFRATEEGPSTWWICQYRFPTQKMSYLKETDMFLHQSQKRTEPDTNSTYLCNSKKAQMDGRWPVKMKQISWYVSQ